MENSGVKIIFDDDPKQIVPLFIGSDLAGFKALQSANIKTLSVLQSFVNSVIPTKSQYPMFISDRSVDLLVNNSVQMSFGTTNSDLFQQPIVYASVKSETDDLTYQKTFEICPHSPIATAEETEQPDFVTIKSFYEGDGVHVDKVDKYKFYEDKIEMITDQGAELVNSIE